MHITTSGVVKGWLSTTEWMEWSFQLLRKARFKLDAVLQSPPSWAGRPDLGHRLQIQLDGINVASGVFDMNAVPYGENLLIKKIGELEMDEGQHSFAIKPEYIESKNLLGFTLVRIVLSRIY
jgi:hypothetical protein